MRLHFGFRFHALCNNRKPMRSRTLFYLFLFSLNLEVFVPHSICSINICWIKLKYILLGQPGTELSSISSHLSLQKSIRELLLLFPFYEWETQIRLREFKTHAMKNSWTFSPLTNFIFYLSNCMIKKENFPICYIQFQKDC